MTGSVRTCWFIAALLFLLVIGVVGVCWIRKHHSRRTAYFSYTQPGPPRTYTTSFPNTENPISENHNWVNAGRCGDPLLCSGGRDANISTCSGVAHGTQDGHIPPPYDDSGAVVAGSWGANQFVEIVVNWDGAFNSNDYDEVEIRLRMTVSPNGTSCYEINCRVGNSGKQYIQMERANAGNGFTPPFAELDGPTAACVNGTVMTATIVNNNLGQPVISAYLDGNLAIQGTDTDGVNALQSGSPGLGFFRQGTNVQNSDFGISSFTASDRFPRFAVQRQLESLAHPEPDYLNDGVPIRRFGVQHSVGIGREYGLGTGSEIAALRAQN